MRILAVVFLAVFSLAPAVFAQPYGPGSTGSGPYGTGAPAPTSLAPGSITLINPLNTGGADCSSTGTCLSAFLTNVLSFVVNIGTVVVILMLVYVGYLFVVAQGVPGKIEEARRALLWTIVGALILLGAEAIAIGIQATVQAISVGK